MRSLVIMFSKNKQQQLAIVLIYVLLLAGGLWHALNVLQPEMRLLASPTIMAVCLLLCFDYGRNVSNGNANRAPAKHGVMATLQQAAKLRWRFIAWSSSVIVASFLIELLGVKTGAVFGVYAYAEVLQPTLWDVPMSIGFAWLGMIISSAAISQRILPGHAAWREIAMPIFIAWFMVIFDFFMEPAAAKLGYWHWAGNMVPLRNYVAWFVFGWILSGIGVRLGLFTKKLSPVALHAYAAQLVYFAMVRMLK